MKNILLLAFIIFAGWKFYTDRQTVANPTTQQKPIRNHSKLTAPVKMVQKPSFKCDGRQHCSQMSSCAEATYFIQHCPNTKMDGDHDGVPCERQWCN